MAGPSPVTASQKTGLEQRSVVLAYALGERTLVPSVQEAGSGVEELLPLPPPIQSPHKIFIGFILCVRHRACSGNTVIMKGANFMDHGQGRDPDRNQGRK